MYRRLVDIDFPNLEQQELFCNRHQDGASKDTPCMCQGGCGQELEMEVGDQEL